MSFIATLIALLLEQARPLSPGNLVHSSMRSWVRTCARTFDTGTVQHAWLSVLFAVMVPALAVMAIWPRRHAAMVMPHIFLVGLVGVQAALGMLTVTWLLKPVIVTMHLMGGMLILAILVGMRAKQGMAVIDPCSMVSRRAQGAGTTCTRSM